MTRKADPTLPRKIVEQARDIAVHAGPQALNMRDIAARLGISATAIYSYYESKDRLLLELKLEAAEMLNARIRGLEQEHDAMEALRRLGEEYVSFAAEHPNLYRLMFETQVGDQPVGEREHPVLYYTYRTARRLLERLREQGLVPHDPRYGAMMGWIMLHGFCSLMWSGSLQLAEGMNREQLKDIFLRFYCAGGHTGWEAQEGPAGLPSPKEET